MLAEASLIYRGKQRKNANEVIRGKTIGSPQALIRGSGAYRRAHTATHRRSDDRPSIAFLSTAALITRRKLARQVRLVEMAAHDVARPLRDSVLHHPALSLGREAEKPVRPLNVNFDLSQIAPMAIVKHKQATWPVGPILTKHQRALIAANRMIPYASWERSKTV